MQFVPKKYLSLIPTPSTAISLILNRASLFVIYYSYQTQTCSFIYVNPFEPCNCYCMQVPRGKINVFPLDTPVCFQPCVILYWKWQHNFAWLLSIWNIWFWQTATKPLFLHTVFSSLANCSPELEWHDWNLPKILQAPPNAPQCTSNYYNFHHMGCECGPCQTLHQ